MAIADILSTARSGLVAAQAALGTVSNNIANVGVTGYAREKVNVSTGVTQGRVSGVIVGEPSRVANRFLEDTVYRRSGDTGRYEAENTYLDRLQGLLGQPGSEGSLPSRVDNIVANAIAMTGMSNAPQTVATFLSSVQDSVNAMQQLTVDANQLQSDVETEIGFSVDKVNNLLTRIDDLNGSVVQLTGLGRSASGAADQRMKAVEELAGLLSINARTQPDGSVHIDTADGVVLLDRRARRIDYPMPGDGVSQSSYPPFAVHFADGGDTGQVLAGAASGGALGGLVNMRDSIIPAFRDQLGSLFGGMAQGLNAASNSASAVPPPASLTGRPTGLVGPDRLGFTGKASFAVTDRTGTLIASTTVDFDALGPAATVNDAVAAINAGLGGNATASLDASGSLRFATSLPNAGVAIGQGSPASARGGTGFSQFFGMNDILVSADSPLVPSGFAAGDPHGFGPGETARLDLRDTAGRILASTTLTGAVGPTMGDLVSELNASPLGTFGSFALDARGRFQFSPVASMAGTRLSIPSDSTDRLGTGLSFTQLSGLTGAWAGLPTGEVRRDLIGDPARMPLSTLKTGAAIGGKALGSGDVSGAAAVVDALNNLQDFVGGTRRTINGYTDDLAGGLGALSAQAAGRAEDSAARKADAVNRRDSFSGVNLDEELAQMIVLQNSYSAAARVMTTATQMYDTLIEMVG